MSEKSSGAKNPGLKIISRQVLDAVKKNASTTYKDVANIVSKQNENNPGLFDLETNCLGQSSYGDLESVDAPARSSAKKGRQA